VARNAALTKTKITGVLLACKQEQVTAGASGEVADNGGFDIDTRLHDKNIVAS
jgi:hypothetical protein